MRLPHEDGSLAAILGDDTSARDTTTVRLLREPLADIRGERQPLPFTEGLPQVPRCDGPLMSVCALLVRIMLALIIIKQPVCVCRAVGAQLLLRIMLALFAALASSVMDGEIVGFTSCMLLERPDTISRLPTWVRADSLQRIKDHYGRTNLVLQFNFAWGWTLEADGIVQGYDAGLWYRELCASFLSERSSSFFAEVDGIDRVQQARCFGVASVLAKTRRHSSSPAPTRQTSRFTSPRPGSRRLLGSLHVEVPVRMSGPWQVAQSLSGSASNLTTKTCSAKRTCTIFPSTLSTNTSSRSRACALTHTWQGIHAVVTFPTAPSAVCSILNRYL